MNEPLLINENNKQTVGNSIVDEEKCHLWSLPLSSRIWSSTDV